MGYILGISGFLLLIGSTLSLWHQNIFLFHLPYRRIARPDRAFGLYRPRADAGREAVEAGEGHHQGKEESP